MANEYDKILRATFKCPQINLLKQLLNVDAVQINALPATVQQTIIEREVDTVVEVKTVAGDAFIVHIEWQSTNDSKMAMRMAKYDLLLLECYEKKVVGIVIYVGAKPLRMVNNLYAYGYQYSCPIIDIRDISPDVFLSSVDPGEVLLAVLAKKGDELPVIRQILAKLQLLTGGDPVMLKEKVKHLELLSQLRGGHLQEFIVKEEENMPITIDITKDLRYRQGKEKGMEEGYREAYKDANFKHALIMLEKGFSITLIQEITGLSTAQLKELQKEIKA